MSAVRGARERARVEVTAAIKDEARRQLADQGAAKLSLRAVARELGMVSSGLYRYFPSRDDLLTALIIDAYDAIGEAAEAALAPAGRATDHDRWVMVCAAVRRWALAHPHEYALIYGSPVPGYAAPQATVGPASRVALVLISVTLDANRTGGLALPPLPETLRPEAGRLAADVAPELPPAVAVALAAAWAQLFGLISFELFGQFHKVVTDRETFFAHAAGNLAESVGLLRRE
ncbi:TetR/AcrR family transcriptional regulator [Streptomyces sp. NBC_01387]|uniref:TetR/AcrR family transcriptional regulator n=1 Tax=unclassified Streptomyces TaxID=2593676 RepID=UPI0020250FE2|nr:MULTISPECIES: TetR/AcrR family transcriptional regulator [unclassified Streptomyces]MCX4552608.1 TetR/AcrR family transcriptional regulator [Streptomyces sp. NBC_01500]WSC23953.1 TetR/AcrR family transcriptional regulator [Streptomyces sp. NBC_01766]WSV57836.1 TetR/AcrR family transcriptional regulator [Streptomyces sp. NBC_01014]